MPLLNYTTTVNPERTVLDIHKALRKAKATSVATLYDDTGPTGVSFVVETNYGTRTFALPVDPVPVHAVLRSQKVAMRYRTIEHARSVAWRITKDWLEAQLALIETGMVSLDQVMLPYMVGIGGTTVYELYVDEQRQAIEAAEG
jgi:hypothetical protein